MASYIFSLRLDVQGSVDLVQFLQFDVFGLLLRLIRVCDVGEAQAIALAFEFARRQVSIGVDAAR